MFKHPLIWVAAYKTERTWTA